MLKDQLLQEAKTIDASVELDSIFESIELSADVKEKFGVVFESAVKKMALALAETHITKIAESAETQVAELVESKSQEAEKTFAEKADKFFAHLAEEWLAENQVEVEKGIKAELFESMFSGLKTLFVEHNVELPAESVDVVAEMEEELAEAKAETSKMFESYTAKSDELKAFKREVLVKESTANLADTTKEKVLSLIEGLEYSEAFEGKLQSIVEFASAKVEAKEKPLTEAVTDPSDGEGLNFVAESVSAKDAPEIDPEMAQYLKASKI